MFCDNALGGPHGLLGALRLRLPALAFGRPAPPGRGVLELGTDLCAGRDDVGVEPSRAVVKFKLVG